MIKEKRYIYEGKPTKYLIRSNGEVWSEVRGRLLVPTTTSNEYLRVQLSIDKKPISLMVHRLVAETFIPNPDNLKQVHHIDGNKWNNDISNLMWVTNKENQDFVGSRAPAIKNDKNFEDYEWIPLEINNNYGACKEGYIANLKTKKVLSGGTRNGYKRVSLNGTFYSAHRLIYETIIGQIPEGGEIDHIDGNRENNSIDNLRLVTRGENMENAFKNGHKGQVKVAQIDSKTNEIIKVYDTIQQAADAMGVTHAAIRSAANRNGTSRGFKWQKLDIS